MRNMEIFIILLYAAIILFFIYRMYKSKKNKNQLNGEVYEFSRPISTMGKVLFAILIVTGGVNLYFGIRDNATNSIITATVMILLALVFALSSRSKFYIAENGLLANSNFYTYKELKKWGFDTEKNDLIMQVKTDGNLNNEIIKVNPENIEEIQKLIKRFKLNK